MANEYSLAIETSCREGGLALGRGGELLQAVRFDASHRHATQLVGRMDELLRAHGLGPGDLAELYVSSGPGSFTGLRVGVTVARTLAQTVAGFRIVAVPTIEAVAENARDLEWQDLGVALDCKDGEVYAMVVGREHVGRASSAARRVLHAEPPAANASARAIPVDRDCTPYEPLFGPALISPDDLLARLPRPAMLIGEALEFAKLEGDRITLAPRDLWLPRPESVWRVGRRLAEAGRFTEYHQLLPLYTRKPEAVRLWEKQGKP